jgi:uncharacterized protein (DUF362 family)/NAD-dependent dihydropyrimidine dehydrogenase PreA subunit
MSQVSLVRCDTYGRPQVEAAVDRAIGLLGGMARFVRPGQRVLIKVNLLRASHPDRAIVTHPEVVRAVALTAREVGGEVIIADSPGGRFSAGTLCRVYRESGLQAMADESGLTLNQDTSTVVLPHPDGVTAKRFEVCRYATQADVIISLPKLKTHGLMRFTGAIKNLFGVLPGLQKIGYHVKHQDVESLSDMLVDVLMLVRPALTVMDGIVGMDGNGPSAGDPFPTDVILAGPDAVAVDVVAVSLVGMEPRSVPALRVAARRGLTTLQPDDVQLVGDSFEAARVEGFRPPATGPDLSRLPDFLRRWATRTMVASPVVGAACTGCGVCHEHCPVGAVTMANGQAHMNLDDCIRCYCCHEMCPSDAVELRQPRLVRALMRS